MKQVTLAQAMRGVGDKPVLPDALADQLVASGVAVTAEPWPPVPLKPRRPVLKVERPIGARDQRTAS